MHFEEAPCVAVAFVQGAHHDVGNVPPRRRRRAARSYAECLYVTFASLMRWNAHMDAVLVTDRPWHYPIPAGVRVHVHPFQHQAPLGPAFSASLYTLDALNALDCELGDSPRPLMLIDPDCVVSDLLDPVFAACDQKVGAYPLDHEPSDDINGLTRDGAAQLAGELDRGRPELATHYGGEVYVFDRKLLAGVRASAEKAYAFSAECARIGGAAFTTEEHILSYCLRHVPVEDLRPYMKRIWTAPSFNTVAPGDQRLAIWHLPAEKGRGFTRAYREACDPTSWFWTAPREQWVEHMGLAMGLRGTLGRRSSDRVVGLIGRARRGLKDWGVRKP